MSHVILTAGPRAAGKTTFCRKFAAAHPEVLLVSLDDLLKIYPPSECCKAREMAWKIMAMLLRLPKAQTVILDFWNFYPEERKGIAAKLRSLGATDLTIWYFVTKRETCERWFVKKPSIRSGKHQAKKLWLKWGLAKIQFLDFVNFPVDLGQGFEIIQLINPEQMSPKKFKAIKSLPNGK